MPGIRPEDRGWVRIQIWIPEEIRYQFRMKMNNNKGDSHNGRKLILAYLNLSDSEAESFIEDNYKDTE